jgi:hypothetical protein
MQPIFADVIWPALLLEKRMFTWWAILAGLVVEYCFVRRLTDLSFLRVIMADLAMNAVSSLLGIFLIPIAGVIWELFPGSILYKIFQIGTFNPGTWIATILMAATINACLERWVLRKFFKQPFPGRRGFWLLFLANLISVAMAFGSLLYSPPEL